MDKTLALLFIVFFTFCAGFVTIAALDTPKRNRRCKLFMYVYAGAMWLDVIAMSVLILIY